MQVPLPDMEDVGESQPSVLAGYGYGLPLSRLYARYFGGDLQVCASATVGLRPHWLCATSDRPVMAMRLLRCRGPLATLRTCTIRALYELTLVCPSCTVHTMRAAACTPCDQRRWRAWTVQVISMEGYGTDAYIHLNRLGDSVEPLP